MEIRTIASSSEGNCYFVSDGVTSLLLEAGIPFKKIQQAMDFKLSGISGVLITHSHMDHAKSVKDMIKAGIDCYMTEPTKTALDIQSHRIKVITPRQQFSIDTWRILPFETQHDCPGSVGFLLASGNEKLLFITDSYYCKYKFNGLTRIMIECNHSYEILDKNIASGALPLSMKKRLIRSHFSLENVKEFLKSNDLSKVQEIHLIHLSSGNSDAELFKREIQALTGKLIYIAGA